MVQFLRKALQGAAYTVGIMAIAVIVVFSAIAGTSGGG